MTQPLQVDVATLHAAARQVRATRTDVAGELRRLQASVDDLAAAWQGPAGNGFQQLMQRWQTDSNVLLTALGEIADLLDTAGARHQANEERQSSVLGGYQAALG